MAHHPSIARAVLAAGWLAGLAACAPQASLPSAADSPKVNLVTEQRLIHVVRFAPGSALMSASEAGRLDRFLESEAVGYGDRVMLTASGGPGPETALGASRERAVARALGRAGLRPLAAGLAEPGSGAAAEVTVTVARFVVTPPDCPDWTRQPAGDITNLAGSNHGCATAVNLGLMLADPGDLLAGRRPGPADGEQGSLGIQRYRAGKVTPLSDSSTAGPGGAAP